MQKKSMLDPIVRALVGVDPAHHGLILDAVNKLGGRDAEAVRVRLAQALRETPSTKTHSDYLVHLISVTLASTKGSVTIAEAKDVFSGDIDPNFQKWGTNVAGQDTETKAVEIHEMKNYGTFAQHFNSLGDPRSLCLTQGQIVEFCRTHRDQLCQISYGNFFLFEVKGELFFALVLVCDGKLNVYVNHFVNDGVGRVGFPHRVVVQHNNLGS